MNTDPYQDFAAQYDLSFGQFGEQDACAIEFFRTLFLKNNVHSVLDCACGTGRHLPLFQSLGCEVAGSDVSQAMLDQAVKNLAGLGLHIPLRRADFRALPRHFDARFDAVVCLASLGYMRDGTECLKALRSMLDVLQGNGLLILTAIPTDRQWKEKPRSQLVANTGDFTRLFIIDYKRCTARYNILDIFHGEDRCELKEWCIDLRVFLQDELERLLAASGFQNLGFFGSFDFVPYSQETSDRLIVAAYK